MSAATVPVSESLLRTLQKPMRNPELVQGYLSGDIASRPARAQPARPVARYGSRFARPRPQRSPDRERSIRRRRTLAATWPMPPSMASMLTTSQMAYARIVYDEVKRSGDCRLTLDEIAARGGMCRKTAKRAQWRLAELGWVKVVQRPVKGRKNLSNIVEVVAKEWVAWIKMGPKPTHRTGGHLRPTTENQSYSISSAVPQESLQRARERKRWPRLGATQLSGGGHAA